MSPYLRIARIDHWIKNIFVIPGALFALVLGHARVQVTWGEIACGLISVCAIVSANYTINEYLDRNADRFHPKKNAREGALGNLSGPLVLAQYMLLSAAGLATAWLVGGYYFAVASSLLAMGILYNVSPFRTKDRVYLDVLSESINNPLRFLLGWFIVSEGIFPPSSILISYWMGGAYLMAVKRFAEYRMFGDPDRAAAYRKSFKFYDENRLLLSSMFYAINSAFFLGIFLIKYRIEFLLSFPLFAILFVWYFHIGLQADSAAQAPEKLYQEKGFMAFVALLAVVVALLFFIDIPALHILQESISR